MTMYMKVPWMQSYEMAVSMNVEKSERDLWILMPDFMGNFSIFIPKSRADRTRTPALGAKTQPASFENSAAHKNPIYSALAP